MKRNHHKSLWLTNCFPRKILRINKTSLSAVGFSVVHVRESHEQSKIKMNNIAPFSYYSNIISANSCCVYGVFLSKLEKVVWQSPEAWLSEEKLRTWIQRNDLIYEGKVTLYSISNAIWAVPTSIPSLRDSSWYLAPSAIQFQFQFFIQS